MKQEDLLERVIIVPWNGYVNRLQAWASASILAERLGAELKVAWETEQVAPAPASTLFSHALMERLFVSVDDVTQQLGQAHTAMPRYLTVDQDQGIAFLAGHDRGEQHFMNELHQVLKATPDVTTLVIVAGGKFHLPHETDFTAKRKHFYNEIAWHPDINDRLTAAQSTDPSYLGVHIRQTDRCREAPTSRAIERAVQALAELSGVTDVFLAGDTAGARQQWCDRLTRLGFSIWMSDAGSFNREESASARDAIVDWLLLGRSEAIIYSAQSSFGQEAAVMTTRPELCRGLQANWTVRGFRDAKRISRSAVKAATGRRSSEQ